MSWSDLLQTRFYYIKRKSKLLAMGLEVSNPKPSKRLKKESYHHTTSLDFSSTSTDHSKAIFERNKIAMKKLLHQKHPRQQRSF